MSVIETLQRFTHRLDEIRVSLRWAAGANPTDAAEMGVATEVRLASFVSTAGALERFFREFVSFVSDELNSVAPSLQSVKLSLHAIVSAGSFRSLQTLRDFQKRWERRVEILERTASLDACSITLLQEDLAMAGETIRPHHVATVWRLFGLPDGPFPKVAYEVAMRVIADNRNDVAHGNLMTRDFVGNPEGKPTQILRRLADVEEWSFHCWEAAERYFNEQLYLRV